MRLLIEVLLDEDQLRDRGMTCEALEEELDRYIAGALDVHTNPRWPKQTVLDYETAFNWEK